MNVMERTHRDRRPVAPPEISVESLPQHNATRVYRVKRGYQVVGYVQYIDCVWYARRSMVGAPGREWFGSLRAAVDHVEGWIS